MFYTGIGSRETPQEIVKVMVAVGEKMGELGWTLRSGGANGADLAFELGCDKVGGKKEIYLPWRGFNGSRSPLFLEGKDCERAEEVASRFHPKWDVLSAGAKKMHTRNVFQVLGLGLNIPSKVVVCYTKGGTGQGGTGQAIRVAKAYKVPIIDMGDYEDVDEAIRNIKRIL